jgi:hypothetical protein
MLIGMGLMAYLLCNKFGNLLSKLGNSLIKKAKIE